MSREWKPGDVAVIKFSAGDERGIWDGEKWLLTGGRAASRAYAVDRLLAVIDYEDMEVVEQVWRWAAATRDAFQAALREFASPTPPKPDEPQGLGARVTDRGGLEWAARTGLHPAPDGMGLIERRWGCLNGSAQDRTWDELLDTRAPLTIEDGAA